MSVFKATTKPVEVEVIQLTESNIRDVLIFMGEPIDEHNYDESYYRHLVENYGMSIWDCNAVASFGDYIIKDDKGLISKCKPDIFKATYDF